MEIISFITDPLVARRILDSRGLPSTAPSPEPARAPPEPTVDGDPAFDDPIS